MTLPEQPPLTEKESNYFEVLQKSCKCKIRREVNPYKLKAKSNFGGRGWYLIQLDSIPCGVFSEVDSLKRSVIGLPETCIMKYLVTIFNTVMNR
jgi:hypothetical protein